MAYADLGRYRTCHSPGLHQRRREVELLLDDHDCRHAADGGGRRTPDRMHVSFRRLDRGSACALCPGPFRKPGLRLFTTARDGDSVRAPPRSQPMSDLTPRSAPKAGAGACDLLRQFRSDEAAADRYAAQCLDKTKFVEPHLRAFEYLPIDVKRRPGPLSGIPVAIKDIIATSDMPTTNDSPIYRDHVPAADAWVVERLRQLGATIFGKTVSTEFAWRQ